MKLFDGRFYDKICQIYEIYLHKIELFEQPFFFIPLEYSQ